MTNQAKHARPSPWVAEWLRQARPTGATVLDVACGGGRHLKLALERGYRVTGVDRDLSAAHDLRNSELVCADLEDGSPWPLASRRFDVVIVTNYLYRPRLPDIVSAVTADGLLIYETFAAGNERFGKPSNPDFLLQPGELLAAVADCLNPLAYEHVTLDAPRCLVQRIVAAGPSHPWLNDPPVRRGAV